MGVGGGGWGGWRVCEISIYNSAVAELSKILGGGEVRPAQLNSITPDGKHLDLQVEKEIIRNTLTIRGDTPEIVRFSRYGGTCLFKTRQWRNDSWFLG